MSFTRFCGMASVILALSAAPKAQADISAQDVWNNWQSQFQAAGYDISATETKSGDTLTITDITVTMPEPEGPASITLRLDQVAFTENNDGTVSVILSEITPLNLLVTDAEGDASEIDMELRQKGLVSTVSGVPTEMLNTYAAQSVDMVLKSITADDREIGADAARGSMGIRGLSGTTTATIGGKRVYDQDIRADSVSYDVFFAAPEDEGEMKANGQMADVSLTGSTALPLAQGATADVTSLLAAGMLSDSEISYSAGASNITLSESGAEVFTNATTSSGGTFNMALSPEELNYSGVQNNLKLTMTVPDSPVPIDIDMIKSGFNLGMPVQKSDRAEDFALGFSLNDFSMSDALWGLFDPTAQLPRNPATVALDLTGKARVLIDMLTPAPETLEGPPIELETLDINTLQIAVAGAELTGNGTFRFDNSTPSDPKPIGGADLSLVGGNKLIDSLVSMGLLPEDQAMGARMMMGLLAVPGDAPDTLNSRIEINEQGHVSANGQRIQ